MPRDITHHNWRKVSYRSNALSFLGGL
eukprot:SAG31_NODE_40112_length_283_cov_0.831522_2_plen_26_part_01